MPAELRHARRGGVLALHILLLCAAERTPPRSSVPLERPGMCGFPSSPGIRGFHHEAGWYRGSLLCGA